MNALYFNRWFLISIFWTPGRASRRSWITERVRGHETAKSETRRQWRVGGKRERWKKERKGRKRKREKEGERDGENTDGIGRRVVNDNDGHRLSQRRRFSSSPLSLSLSSIPRSDDALRRVSPYCRDKYKAYFARSPIHPLATSFACVIYAVEDRFFFDEIYLFQNDFSKKDSNFFILN